MLKAIHRSIRMENLARESAPEGTVTLGMGQGVNEGE